jgi:membrane-bound metal-dependent hydrolase YbcI (DUF457 family)
MKGLTHVFFGIGFVSILILYSNLSIVYWGVGTFIIAPIFSRLPDKDQKIAQITFNQIVPHRGKLSHNLLYGLPIFFIFTLEKMSFIGDILSTLIVSIFGALFAHALIDALNHSGVWIGVIRTKGFLKWDSFFGNLGLKLTGLILFFISVTNIFLLIFFEVLNLKS